MKKVVSENEKVPLRLSEEQIQLIREHTFADSELLNAFNIAEVVSKTKRQAMYTLYDLEDLEGHVAAAANHCEDRKLQGKLDTIFLTIQRVQDKYDLDYDE